MTVRVLETRDGEVGRTITFVPRRLPDFSIVPVAGVTFSPGYPDNLTALERIAFANRGQLPSCELTREPTNEHDPNAVVVTVPALAAYGHDPKLGHLSRALAARIAHEMDDGVAWAGQVIEVLTARMDRPGVRMYIYRKDHA